MHIIYTNKKIERYFEDYRLMKRKLPEEWVRSIKKHINRLEAADRFGDFLKLNLGHPEALIGKDIGKYSLHISGNVRLIIVPVGEGEDVMEYSVVELKGVVDYHGTKETWYIP